MWVPPLLYPCKVLNPIQRVLLSLRKLRLGSHFLHPDGRILNPRRRFMQPLPQRPDGAAKTKSAIGFEVFHLVCSLPVFCDALHGVRFLIWWPLIRERRIHKP
jgi:hypothetical protein